MGAVRRGVLVHQALQRGLFRAVALAVDRSAVRRPLGLPEHSLLRAVAQQKPVAVPRQADSLAQALRDASPQLNVVQRAARSAA